MGSARISTIALAGACALLAGCSSADSGGDNAGNTQDTALALDVGVDQPDAAGADDALPGDTTADGGGATGDDGAGSGGDGGSDDGVAIEEDVSIEDDGGDNDGGSNDDSGSEDAAAPECGPDLPCEQPNTGGCLVVACVDGACVGSTKGDGEPCEDDGVVCTVDACLDAECEHTVDHGACDDGNLCTTNSCDLTIGCTPTDVVDGVACTDDAVGCTKDTCVAGACTHLEQDDVCQGADPCKVYSCEAASGGCVDTAVADGTACVLEGGTSGVCTAGVCSYDCQGPLCDADGDGLTDAEENAYGADCAITNMFVADSDNDGIPDAQDAYPKDPFPPFMVVENGHGTIDVYLTDPNNNGAFQAKVETGKLLGDVCAKPDTECGSCPSGQICSLGECIAEGQGCAGGCPASGEVCRPTLYRTMQVGDFDADGTMDFIAQSWPENDKGQREVWYFNRPTAGGQFSQQYVGVVDSAIRGVLADFNGDYKQDLVGWTTTKQANGYVGSVVMHTWLGTGNMKAGCAVGQGCAFTYIPVAVDISSKTQGQWGFRVSFSALDQNADGKNDIVFLTYASGGNSPAPVYLLLGNGDGTFDFSNQTPLLTHNQGGKQAPANAVIFADFDGDKVGDVLAGLDDDGDPGAMWLYKGTGPGQFASGSTKVLDINPGTNSGSDKPGNTGAARTFDFNFDGLMDVIIGHRHTKAWDPPSKTEVFYGTGGGQFGPPVTVGPASYQGNQGMRFAIPQRLCPWYPAGK